ncbi:MAG: sigma-70 family RNA polymerase sigma factor [Blastocatellia bacterium]
MSSLVEDAAKLRAAERDQLIEQHRPYVRALAIEIAKKLPDHLDLEDLVACGYLGLVEAADRYDARYRVSFHTFAWYRIRGAIYDSLRQMGPLSRGDYANVRRAGLANDTLQSHADDSQNHPPGQGLSVDDEITATEEAIDALLPVYLLSLDAEETFDVADQKPTTLEEMEKRELMTLARNLVSALQDDDRQMLEAIYFGGYNIVEYAKKIGVTKSWASRLHARAIKRLRALMVQQGYLAEE